MTDILNNSPTHQAITDAINELDEYVYDDIVDQVIKDNSYLFDELLEQFNEDPTSDESEYEYEDDTDE